METNELLDSWCLTGTGYNKFSTAIKDLEASTLIVPTESANLSLYAITGKAEEFVSLALFDADQTMEQRLPGRTKLRLASITSKGGTDEFIEDAISSRLIIKDKDCILFTSRNLTRDLGARARVTGDGLNVPSPERDAFLMHRYVEAPTPIHLVVRRNTSDGGHIGKIFAMPSSEYRYIPQTVLLELADYFDKSLGGAGTVRWNISHNISQLWLEFPKQAEDIAKTYGLPDSLTPGVLLETSDTGDCALKVIPTWSASSTRHVTMEEFKREHKGNFDIEVIKGKIKEVVFSGYTKLPERLCELLLMDVEYPAAFWEVIFEETKMEALVGKRRYTDILESLQGEINPSANYTAYDFAMRLMDVPVLFKENAEKCSLLQHNIYRFPFMNIKKMLSMTEPIAMRT